VQSKTKVEFDNLTTNAEPLEQDQHGVKVYRLPNEKILKLFWRRNKISSQIWAPHAQRFARNALILKNRHIPTIDVESIFKLPHLKCDAVLYHELPGTTLRSWLRAHSGNDQQDKIQQFGQFVSRLHDKGIHFRSLHLGNVLVTPNGSFALIDIVDMTFQHFGKSTISKRLRNLRHIARYKEDRQLMVSEGDNVFIDSYLEASHLSEADNKQLRSVYFQLFLT